MGEFVASESTGMFGDSGFVNQGGIDVTYIPFLNQHFAVGGDGSTSSLMNSSDNGVTWSIQSGVSGFTAGATGICFSEDSQHIVIVGNMVGVNAEAIFSANGGATWGSVTAIAGVFGTLDSCAYNGNVRRWVFTGLSPTSQGLLAHCNDPPDACAEIDMTSDLLKRGRGIAARPRGPLLVAPATTVVTSGETISVAVVSGNLVLESGSTIAAQAGMPTTVTGTVTIDNSTLVIQGVVASSTIFALTAMSISGTFRSVLATAQDSCQSAEVTGTSYGAQTVSVTVAISGDVCSSSPLSTGAIVGIAVGGAIGAVLLVVFLVWLMRNYSKRRDEKVNREIRMKDLS
jgi:hypothetical protein